MNLQQTEMILRTHTGRVRKVNEDSVAILPEYGLVILADGMGGYNAGDVASHLAVETVTSNLVPILPSANPETIGMPMVLAVEAANETILTTMEEDPATQGMGTTVVVGLFADNQVYYAHVGDSRLYRYSAGELQQLTRDHSMIQELVDQGMYQSVAEAKLAGVKNNILVRGLGIGNEVEVDFASEPLRTEELFLFCSDGLSNMVPDDRVVEILDSSGNDWEAAADRLLEEALEQGGLDNITLALVAPSI